jgi:hypothetical protein
MAPVESPGWVSVEVVAATDAEDNEIGVEKVDEELENESVLRATVTLEDDRETGAMTGAVDTVVAGLVGAWSGVPVPTEAAAAGVSLFVGVAGNSPDHDGLLPPIAEELRAPTKSVAMKILFTLKNYTKSKTEEA